MKRDFEYVIRACPNCGCFDVTYEEDDPGQEPEVECLNCQAAMVIDGKRISHEDLSRSLNIADLRPNY